MSSDRRRFIKHITAGTAGVALGGLIKAAAPADYFKMFPTPPLLRGNGDSTVFPFFKYADVYNIGEYIPKDQGGKFIQISVIGSEEDQKITSAIRGGIVKQVYGDPTGWQRYEKSEIEKSVWLNRFYFLPSFARLYHLTGDRSYLDDMMNIIRGWIEDNPRLPDSHRTTYNWRDMQVAWRSIHLSWCYFLGGKGLTAEERGIIVTTLKDHAHILITGFGQAKLNEFNHQSHGALAMLYLGILFPMLDEAEKLIERAIIILNHHLDKAFYPDGGNVEHMFGYYPFEAHIFRDAFLLCRANGLVPPVNTLPMLRKMAGYITSVALPDGTMPRINDSYEMPVQPTLDILNEILDDQPISLSHGSVCLPDSQVAVMRGKEEGGWYLLAHPALVIGSHSHAGRLGFELWHGGKPLITESGCCNYDDPALVSWFRTSRAHNTVIIDGISDEATSSDLLWVPRRETMNRITGWMPGDRLSHLTMVSPAEETVNSSVKWTRQIILVKERVAVISDTFESDGDHTYEILLHFPPSVVEKDDISKSLKVNAPSGAIVIPADPGFIKELRVTEGLISIRGISTPTPVAAYMIEGSGTIQSYLVIAPSGRVEVSQRKKKGGTVLTLTEEDGGRTRISLTAKGIKLT